MKTLFYNVMFFNHKTKKISGDIALFNLEDWWTSSFSEAEREHIVEVFQPLGAPKNILVEGDFKHTGDERPLMFLSSLASWFDNIKDRYLAYKIIEKAEEYVRLEKNIIDKHFFWPTKARIFYGDRDDPVALQKVIDACLKSIAMAEDAAEAFKKQFHDHVLPSHTCYERLCIIYEKQGKYEEVIRLAKQAKLQGWNGDWDVRIKRCEKKINNKPA